MGKKNVISVIFFCHCFYFLSAQNPSDLHSILVFSKPQTNLVSVNSKAIDQLYRSSLSHRFRIDTTADTQKFVEENLRKYEAIVFLNTSANTLNRTQLVELQRFIAAGGGFVGIHSAAEFRNNSIWYQNLIGGATPTQLAAKTTLSMMLVADLGKSNIEPYFNIIDSPLLFNTLAPKYKPALIDINNKVFAWHYTTAMSGKVFYTALGGDEAAYQNSNFIQLLWAGIKEVATNPNYSKSIPSTLPNNVYFLKQILCNKLISPNAFVNLPNNNALISQKDGSLFYFDSERRNLKKLSNINFLEKNEKLKLDPDFTQNGYFYAFLSDSLHQEYLVRRMQLLGDSAVQISDFENKSMRSIRSEVIYNYGNYADYPNRFPAYFNNKIFKFNTETKEFIIETYDTEGNIQEREPFLENKKFDNPSNIAFGADGALYFLEKNSFVKLDYAAQKRPPVAVLKATITAGKAPLKVKFSALDSYAFNNEPLLYFWQFDDKNTSIEPEPEFIFNKPQLNLVKLTVTDSQGLSNEKSLLIKVEKTTKQFRK